MGDTPMDSSSLDRSQVVGTERAHLPSAAPPTNHGHTTAAWVTVSLVIVGAVVASVAVLTALPWLFWVGIGVVVVAVVVGLVLKVLGLGQPGGPRRRSAAASADIGPSKEQV
jgi:hypothetical protein